MFKHKLNVPDDVIQEMVAMSKAGIYHKDISKKFNISTSSVGRILRSNGINFFHKKTDEERQSVIDLYLSGMTQHQVAKTLDMGETTVGTILKQENVPGRDQSHAKRKYKIDEHYFDKIDTPNKAYFLGLLYADGNIGKKHTEVKISLQECDKSILEKFRDELQSDQPLSFITRYHDMNPRYKNQWALNISNKNLHDSLVTHGVLPNKSLVLTYPEWLNPDLESHFIRGYINGDGHIAKDGHIVSITSSEAFCHSVENVLKRRFNTICRIYDKSKGTKPTRTLSIYRKNQIKIVLDWIYQDAEMYIDRKYQVYKINYAS